MTDLSEYLWRQGHRVDRWAKPRDSLDDYEDVVDLTGAWGSIADTAEVTVRV